MNILSIDPHLRRMAMALCVYETEEVAWVGDAKVDQKDAPLVDIVEGWFHWAMEFDHELGFDGAVIEIPDHITGKKSNKQVQDLIKVALSVGSVCGGLASREITVKLLEPRTWKGNRSKGRTRMELRGAVGREVKGWDEHIVDAAGLGLWWIRHLKSNDISG